jgi:uncharacterized protein YegL
MKKNKSEIVIVLDRSGSMSSIKNDIELGFKEFLNKQKAIPGEAFVSLYQFDNISEKVYELKNISEISSISIEPRGGTALIDAVSRAINDVGERLKATKEEDRPENVIFLILTDGEENSSKEFTLEKMKESITHQQDVYSWKFVFLGTNIDAISAGSSYGVAVGTTLGFASTSKGISSTFDTLSKATACYRSNVGYDFTEEDRTEASSK